MNIDVEWVYRRGGWRVALGVRSLAGAVYAGLGSAGARIGRAVGEWAQRRFGPSSVLGAAWDTSRMAIVMIVVLCVFLVSL